MLKLKHPRQQGYSALSPYRTALWSAARQHAAARPQILSGKKWPRLLRHPAMAGCLALVLLFAHTAQAGKVLNDALATKPFSHHILQEVINQNMNSQGEMYLLQLRAHPRRLNQYLEQLAAVSPDSNPDYFPGTDDQLAYWLNAHNAVALRVILDHIPIERLADVPDFLANTRYRLGGRPYSLALIESRIAHAYGRYPGILFAVTDYTRNTPPLFAQAYQGRFLRQQLMAGQKAALADGHMLRVDRRNPACLGLQLSPFFKRFDRVLLSLPDPNAEDADLIPEESETMPNRPRTWTDVMRPFVAPDVYADLGTACAHPVGFFPVDSTLRQVRP